MSPTPTQSAPLLILKVSGHELDNPDFLERLIAQIAALTQPIILVHGGGKEINAALEQYNLPIEFVNGLRITPPASMHVMEMVVSGSIGKRLVRQCIGAGIAALSLSGVDLGILGCVPYRPAGLDLQQVGEIVSVNTETLQIMLAQGWLPIIAPVALGVADRLPYNVNADFVAQAIAAAFAATTPTELVYISNLAGILIADQVVPTMTAHDIEQQIAHGHIYGGMIPKVQAALQALAAGCTTVRITDLAGLGAGGTRITAASLP